MMMSSPSDQQPQAGSEAQAAEDGRAPEQGPEAAPQADAPRPVAKEDFVRLYEAAFG